MYEYLMFTNLNYQKKIDRLGKIKGEIGLMLSNYRVSSKRMGLTRMPPIHLMCSLLDQDIPEIKYSSFVQENQKSNQEFLYFHHLFTLGLTAISHAYKPEITDRRRKIFDAFCLRIINYSRERSDPLSEKCDRR